MCKKIARIHHGRMTGMLIESYTAATKKKKKKFGKVVENADMIHNPMRMFGCQ